LPFEQTLKVAWDLRRERKNISKTINKANGLQRFFLCKPFALKHKS